MNKHMKNYGNKSNNTYDKIKYQHRKTNTDKACVQLHWRSLDNEQLVGKEFEGAEASHLCPFPNKGGYTHTVIGRGNLGVYIVN